MIRRAFTLVEVILALSIIVILVSTIAATLNVAFGSKRSAENAMAAVQAIQAIGDVWVIDVANIVPPSPLSASEDSMAYQVAATQFTADNPNASDLANESGGIVGMGSNSGLTLGSYYLFGPFKGDSRTLNFYTTGPEPKSAIQGDVRHIQYSLSLQQNNHYALVRRVDTNILASTPVEQLPEEVIVIDVKDVHFSFYNGESWVDSWDTTETNTNNALPYAVSMEMTLEPLRVGQADRTITRFATIWCAQKSVIDSNYSSAASQAAAETQSNGSGIISQ